MTKQEDAELRKALRELGVYDDGSYSSITDEGVDAVINFIKALIRTEKLKLLAEVRERVVGEDEVFVDLPIVDGTGKTISIIDRSFTTNMVVKNHLRAEQRNKLNKLEAEL